MYGLKIRFFNFAIMSSFPLKYKKEGILFCLVSIQAHTVLALKALKIDTLSDFI